MFISSVSVAGCTSAYGSTAAGDGGGAFVLSAARVGKASAAAKNTTGEKRRNFTGMEFSGGKEVCVLFAGIVGHSHGERCAPLIEDMYSGRSMGNLPGAGALNRLFDHRVVGRSHQKGNSPTPPVIAIEMPDDDFAEPCALVIRVLIFAGGNLDRIAAFGAALFGQKSTDVVADIHIGLLGSDS